MTATANVSSKTEARLPATTITRLYVRYVGDKRTGFFEVPAHIPRKALFNTCGSGSIRIVTGSNPPAMGKSGEKRFPDRQITQMADLIMIYRVANSGWKSVSAIRFRTWLPFVAVICEFPALRLLPMGSGRHIYSDAPAGLPLPCICRTTSLP